MKIQEWLEFFKKFKNISIFHINHLKLLTKADAHSLRVALSRLDGNKIVKRICRGFYANPFNLPTLEEIAGRIYEPSYISLESALSNYGILSQIPTVLTCVTTRLPRVFKTSFGIIEYRQIRPGLFWGYVKKRSHFIAEPEKALLDYLYLSKDKKFKLSLLGLEGVNIKKTEKYAKKMNMKKMATLLKGYIHSL